MLRGEKQTIVTNVTSDLTKAAGALFLDFTGLTVAEADAFRIKVRNEGKGTMSYRVIKNTLLSRAMKGTTFEPASKNLKGTPTGVLIGFEDPIAAAKLTFEFLKGCEHLKVKGGIVEKQPLNAKQAEALSKMPGRKELLGGIVATAQGPGKKLLSQVKSPGARVAGAIKALVEKLEKAGA